MYVRLSAFEFLQMVQWCKENEIATLAIETLFVEDGYARMDGVTRDRMFVELDDAVKQMQNYSSVFLSSVTVFCYNLCVANKIDNAAFVLRWGEYVR